MSELTSAEENLRVIRTLMERSSIYRALSAPGALIAGVMATAAGLVAWNLHADGLSFFAVWGGVLTTAVAVNFWFLYRESARRGTPFFSRSMRMALGAMTPPLAAGFILSGFFILDQDALPYSWMIFYGLALLATGHFAPRSLVLLGITFLTLGLVVPLFFLFEAFHSAVGDLALNHPEPNLVMAGSFGLLHLAYALLAWPRKT